jgi:hypothetical protein
MADAKRGRKADGRTGVTRRATGFVAAFLFLSLLAWPDMYKKIDKLAQKCRQGDVEACAELSAIARYEKDGNVRVAAASELRDARLAQLIFASIAKYDADSTARMAAVRKLTDLALLQDVAQYAKNAAVRDEAAGMLSGPEQTATAAGNAETAAGPPPAAREAPGPAAAGMIGGQAAGPPPPLSARDFPIRRIQLVVPSLKREFEMSYLGDAARPEPEADALNAQCFWRLFADLPLAELKRRLDAEKGISVLIDEAAEVLKKQDRQLLVTDDRYKGRTYFWQSPGHAANENAMWISYEIRTIMNGPESLFTIELLVPGKRKPKRMCLYSAKGPIGLTYMLGVDDKGVDMSADIKKFIANVAGALKEKK